LICNRRVRISVFLLTSKLGSPGASALIRIKAQGGDGLQFTC
jgi:hypothetical protein